MNLQYSFMQVNQESSAFQSSEYRYYIILTGNGYFSDSSRTFFLESHDVLEVPNGKSLKPSCTAPVQIGVVSIHDFHSPNTIIQKKSYQDTELILRVFLFAIEFQGLHHKAVPGLLYYVDKLMYEVLSKTGLEEYQINPRIADFLTELNQRYMDPDLNLNELIKKSGYSRSHFHKLFHDTTGKSPIECIHERRIERALYLLSQSNRPSVKEVALQCGFADPYYFSRVFRKITGIAPSEVEHA